MPKSNKNEAKWISAGSDVDREFAAVYYDSLEKTIDVAVKDLDRSSSLSREDSSLIPLENTCLPF